MFSILSKAKLVIYLEFILLSANAFDLKEFKIQSFCKDLSVFSKQENFWLIDFKAFADYNIIYCTLMVIFVCDWEENIVGRGENAGL